MRWLIGIVSALAIITAAQAEGMPRAAEESFYKTQPEGLSYAVNARPGVRGQKNGRQMLLCYGAGSGGGPSDRIIVFVKEKDESLPRVTELPDGRAEVDMRHRIPVPSDDVSSWTEQMCLQAFGALAQTSSLASYPDLSPFFARIELPYRQFDNWRKARGYRKPTFWAGAAASNRLEKPKRGRPAEYNWVGVKKRLVEYANKQGPVQNWDELIQKCAELASDLHPQRKTPDESTIRAAIETHELDKPPVTSSAK
jgi:hypothetical protein